MLIVKVPLRVASMAWKPPTLWKVGGPDGGVVEKNRRMSCALPPVASLATWISCGCGPELVIAHVLLPLGNVSGESKEKSRSVMVTGAFGVVAGAVVLAPVTWSCLIMPLAKCGTPSAPAMKHNTT